VLANRAFAQWLMLKKYVTYSLSLCWVTISMLNAIAYRRTERFAKLRRHVLRHPARKAGNASIVAGPLKQLRAAHNAAMPDAATHNFFPSPLGS
jgi:hypothetical protein